MASSGVTGRRPTGATSTRSPISSSASATIPTRTSPRPSPSERALIPEHDGAVSATQRYLLPQTEEMMMLQKVTAVVLIGATIVLAACNTVRGAAKDVNSVANCTENTINGHQCH